MKGVLDRTCKKAEVGQNNTSPKVAPELGLFMVDILKKPQGLLERIPWITVERDLSASQCGDNDL